MGYYLSALTVFQTRYGILACPYKRSKTYLLPMTRVSPTAEVSMLALVLLCPCKSAPFVVAYMPTSTAGPAPCEPPQVLDTSADGRSPSGITAQEP